MVNKYIFSWNGYLINRRTQHVLCEQIWRVSLEKAKEQKCGQTIRGKQEERAMQMYSVGRQYENLENILSFDSSGYLF